MGVMLAVRQIIRANMLTLPVPVIVSTFLFQLDRRKTTLEQCSATTPGHPKSIPGNASVVKEDGVNAD